MPVTSDDMIKSLEKEWRGSPEQCLPFDLLKKVTIQANKEHMTPGDIVIRAVEYYLEKKGGD